MRHIIFFNTFNESLDINSGLKFNIRSTVDGYIKLKNEDPSIPGNSENEIDKFIITDPREYFNYRLGTKKDTENRSSLDSENILRIRIGGKDFTGRDGGVTHIMVRVPDNFDYSKFESKLSNIRHVATKKPDVERVINEIGSLIYECIGGVSNTSIDSYTAENENYEESILEFINPIVDKIGKENVKNLLMKIVDQL